MMGDIASNAARAMGAECAANSIESAVDVLHVVSTVIDLRNLRGLAMSMAGNVGKVGRKRAGGGADYDPGAAGQGKSFGGGGSGGTGSGGGGGGAQGTFFRGGQSLEARLGVDVKTAADGLIHPTAKNGKAQGLSVNLDPKDKFIQQYGGAFPVNSLPEGLQVVQSGKPGHFVIAPSIPMPFESYQKLLNQIQLGNFNVLR